MDAEIRRYERALQRSGADVVVIPKKMLSALKFIITGDKKNYVEGLAPSRVRQIGHYVAL